MFPVVLTSFVFSSIKVAKKTPTKKTPPPKKVEEDSDSSDSSDEEEEVSVKENLYQKAVLWTKYLLPIFLMQLELIQMKCYVLLL